jgi:lysophospholipase L1-like esterase/RNase H-fold protein (predicted Holliday junction resolvase)
MTALLIGLCHLVFSGDTSFAESRAVPSVADVTTLLKSGETMVRVVCFGDSITGVYYHSGSQRAWCDMLGLGLQKAYPNAKIKMINAGISGHTTANGLARIDKDVIAQKPHLVVVMFGMNDIARVKPENFQDNLQEIVRRCTAAGAAVVLCTPNSVYENTARPNAGLENLSKRVRQVASEHKLPVVDCFKAWQDIRRRSETEWMLLMSDTIHPNMHGHTRFAELITKTVSGKTVALGDVAPPADGLQVTFDRLHNEQPVTLVAMPPYDKLLPEVLLAKFPQAKLQVTSWPVEGKSVAELSEWSKRVRGMNPHLVVVAVPANATDKSQGDYIRNYEWVLNRSFHFSRRLWDVLPVLPSATGPVADDDHDRALLAQKLVQGKDVQLLDRRPGDSRSAKAILAEWVAQRSKQWKLTSKR